MQMIQKHYEAVCPLFVKTRSFDRVKELLDNNGFVIIKGNPGTGKTTIAKMLMKELMDEGNSPLQLYKLTDLYGSISPGDGIVLFIDNLFGEFSLSRDDVQQFKAMRGMIQVLSESDSDKKSNSLIFVLRNDIYKEYAQIGCDDDFFLSSLVDLSSKENSLLKEEILQLSQKYDISNNFDEDKELINKSAASSGDKNAFNLLLKFGFDPYRKDRYIGHTVLTCACQDGKTDMVKYLVETYPDLLKEHTDFQGNSLFITPTVDGKNKLGETILHAACENGHYNMGEYLLSKYPQLLDVCSTDGYNVLHAAALGGNVDLFKYLSSKGLNVYCKTNNGVTVFHMCCDEGREEMFRYLVNRYPGLTSVIDNKGWTVLHSACWGGNVEIVSFLIDKGMDINTLSNDGRSILHRACLNGKFEVCEYLVENYPHLLDVKDKSSNTVLHDAARGGNVQIIELLIEKKMDIKILQKEGDTILHQCCRSCKMEMCEHLVNHYSELLEIRYNFGLTVLHSACCGGSVEIVSFLLERGMNINALSNKGKNILHIACINGKFEVCVYLVENYPHLLDVKDKSSYTVLHAAGWGGNVQIVKLLIEKNMDINAQQRDGETILHQCCLSGEMKMYEYLVNNFPNLLKIRDNTGWTVLHSACKGGSVEMISFLLQNGLESNALSNDCENILHIACMNGKHDVCKYLSTNYPNLLDVRDGHGQSVMDIATECGDIDMIHLLREK
ncbi:putative ankyrin repeat protein RF_0381 [Saccostrea cucullata]|uniref:putative ankyrin repeat protein RF_0381 n=1 Tax=Saccostrea cuccullata TaxID=36930 RepID=UPI002ED1FA81